MATATKPRRKAAQKKFGPIEDAELEGQIKELEDLGDELDTVRTERIGYSFIFPSPLCVVKMRSRWPAASPRSTGRKDRPLISPGP